MHNTNSIFVLPYIPWLQYSLILYSPPPVLNQNTGRAPALSVFDLLHSCTSHKMLLGEGMTLYAFFRHQALVIQGPLVQPCSHSTERTTTDTKQLYKTHTWKHTFSNIFSLKKPSLLNLAKQPHQALGNRGNNSGSRESKITHVCAKSQFLPWKMLPLLVFCFLSKYRSFEAFFNRQKH